MKKMTFLTLAIVAGASLASIQAQAQTQAQTRAQTGDRRPDVPPFAEIDADGDGEVTAEELRAAREARGPAWLAEFDADGDGMMDRDELLAMSAARAAPRVDRMLADLDLDGDERLTARELAVRPDGPRAGRREGRHDRGGHRGGDRPRFHGPRVDDRGSIMFERADTDGDGSLSAAEWDAAAPRDGN